MSLLEEEGHSQAEVARMVGSSRSSVCRWRKVARRKNGLAAKPHPGRPRRLKPAQHRRLARELAKGATAHGFPNDLRRPGIGLTGRGAWWYSGMVGASSSRSA